MVDNGTLKVKSDMDLVECGRLAKDYARSINGVDSLFVDFDAERPTVFAVQTIVACQKSLIAQGAFRGFGPIAALILSTTVPAGDHQGGDLG